MSAAWLFAALTVREMSRRRLLLALAAVTAVAIGLSAWGIARIEGSQAHSGLTAGETALGLSQVLSLVMFLFSVVLVMAAVFAAVASVASDLESGTALAVLARPVRRMEVLAGRWLGLAALVVAYTGATCLVEFWLVARLTGLRPADPVAAALYLAGEGLCVMTLAVLLGTRMSAMAGGLVATAVFFLTWMAGVVGALGPVFRSGFLTEVGVVSRLIVPTDGLWRGALFHLEPTSVLILAHSDPALAGNPLIGVVPPSGPYVVWAVAWALGVLALAVWSLATRDL